MLFQRPYRLAALLIVHIIGMTEHSRASIIYYSPEDIENETDTTYYPYDNEEVKNLDIFRDKPNPNTGPHFAMTEEETNVTGMVGQTIYLHCCVRNLGNRTVSWVRHRDIHLLTVGRYTYTSDQRFESVHRPHSDKWSLKIKYPQKKDSGIYECQISTTPPNSLAVYLTIKEAVTVIVGGSDLFIDNGSTINLTCLLEYIPELPPDIQWKHGHQEIDFDSPRGGVNLVTVKGIPTTTSRLMIREATIRDSGEYTCAPSNAKPATIRVHILNGEHPAAMYHGYGSMPMCSPVVSAFIVSSTLLLRWMYIR